MALSDKLVSELLLGVGVPTPGFGDPDIFPAAGRRIPDVIPMLTQTARSAAYTRTRILLRFLELLSDATPSKVDNAFVESRLGLKGGDVRAFMQSLRVLGLVNGEGGLTERAKRTRAQSQRGAAMREALKEAYPELVQLWQARGDMPREEVEDFFKLDYGLSTSTAGPAAKLFCDLMREYAGPGARDQEPGAAERGSVFRAPVPGFAGATDVLRERGVGEPAVTPQRGEWSDPLNADPVSSLSVRRTPPLSLTDESRRPSPVPPATMDVRLAAVEAVTRQFQIQITADWKPEMIQLVFDRMERLVQQILD